MTVLFYPPTFSQGPSWDPQTVREKGREELRWPEVAWVFPEIWLLSSAAWPLPRLAWASS